MDREVGFILSPSGAFRQHVRTELRRRGPTLRLAMLAELLRFRRRDHAGCKLWCRRRRRVHRILAQSPHRRLSWSGSSRRRGVRQGGFLALVWCVGSGFVVPMAMAAATQRPNSIGFMRRGDHSATRHARDDGDSPSPRKISFAMTRAAQEHGAVPIRVGSATLFGVPMHQRRAALRSMAPPSMPTSFSSRATLVPLTADWIRLPSAFGKRSPGLATTREPMFQRCSVP